MTNQSTQKGKDMKILCETGNSFSEDGTPISGHNFVEVKQPGSKKEVLKCLICGEESIGYITGDTKQL